MKREDDRAQRFQRAVQSADGAEIRRLFEAHPELSSVIDEPWFAFGKTALSEVAVHGKRDAVIALLDLGADPNAKSDWEAGPYSALHCLVDRRPPIDVDLADYLISRGATLDIHTAAGLGRLDRIEAILDAVPECVSEAGPDGATPLHLAANAEVATLLLDRGADIEKRCVDHNSTPAQWSVMGREDVTRLLLDRGARPDLFMAAVLDDVSLARTILEADPTAIDVRVRPGRSHAHIGFGDKYVWALDFADTPLEVARRRGHDAVYAFLLTQSGPFTRLLHATRQGDMDTIRATVDAQPGLLSGLREEQVCDLLNGTAPAAAYFLDAGLDPNARDDDTRATAAHHAAWRGEGDRLQLLIERGASCMIRDATHGSTPYGWADFAGHTELAEWLADNAALDIVDSAWLGRTERVREILANDPKAAKALQNGKVSPLRTAVSAGHVEIVRLLLDHGADPSLASPDTGATALDIARSEGNAAIAEMLGA